MTASFTVLASGSSGNAAFLRTGGFGLLIDCGIGVRSMARRLASSGFSWADVDAVALTHTHSDHWNDTSLEQIASRRIPLYCHTSHVHSLESASGAYTNIAAARVLMRYDAGRPFSPTDSIAITPLTLSHDSHQTFGFRIERTRGQAFAIGYAADLGCYDDAIVRALCDVDVLAVEFNHDVAMQRQSGRSAMLINRVLGPGGHLSNQQGADLVDHVLRRSRRVQPRFVVPLHLSRQCNTAKLAENAAADAIQRQGSRAAIVATHQLTASRKMILTSPPTLFEVGENRELRPEPADA